jgi:hypothetical protein
MGYLKKTHISKCLGVIPQLRGTLSFAVSNRVAYNQAMFFTDHKKIFRIFLYLLLFLISFLVFDSITVVATVLLAVAALDLFLFRADRKKER